jgi:hypothetical protein
MECGLAFDEGDERKELACGHAMHPACYAKVLDRIERGVLGYSGENAEPGYKELKRYLDAAEDAIRRKLALERHEALWDPNLAARMDRMGTWMTGTKNKTRSRS